MPIKEKLFEDKNYGRRTGGSRMKEGEVFKRHLNKEEIRNKLKITCCLSKKKAQQKKRSQ